MSAYRFGEPNDRALPRTRVAAMLVLVAFVAPILPALTTVAGAENETRASWIVWAIGTVPGLAIAAAGASRPRTARVVAGVAIFELLATAIGYFVVYIAAGGGA